MLFCERDYSYFVTYITMQDVARVEGEKSITAEAHSITEYPLVEPPVSKVSRNSKLQVI